MKVDDFGPLDAAMSTLVTRFAIPSEVQAFIDDGFLAPLSENDAEKTVEFHIPSLQFTDERGRTTDFTLVWIHPDHNAQFCHYYHQTPGDLVNFYIRRDTTDLGDEILDIDSLDDLVYWLEEKRQSR